MNCIRNIKYFFLIAAIFLQFSTINATLIQCFQCGSGDNDKCPEKLSGELLKSCTEENCTECYTKIDNNGNISRGCLDKSDTACKADPNCVISTAEANNQIVCKTCDGADVQCSEIDMSSNDAKYNKICVGANERCFVKVENKLVTRGCADKCNDSNLCKICETDKCNAGLYPPERIKCYQCNGNTCNDVAANSSELPTPCLNYVENDACYSKGESDTTMIRGCKSDTKNNQCSAETKGCAFCSKDNCNNLKYKHDQTRKCHQCTGEKADSDCFKEQTSTEYEKCKQQILYSDDENCYTNVNGDNIQRGCLLDRNDLSIEKCTDNDTDTCTKCNKTDGCNSAVKKAEELTCIVCRSDLNDLCWDKAEQVQGQTCRTGTGSFKDGCFYGIWNGVLIRGCTMDASVQVQEVCKDKDNNQCHICYTKNCNKQKSGASKITLNLAFIFMLFATLWNFK